MKTKNVAIGLCLFIIAVIIALVAMLLGHLLILMSSDDLAVLAAIPVIIVYVKDGNVLAVWATDPHLEVILQDEDNIAAGDPPPINDADMQKLHMESTPECSAEIKQGKFFQVF